MTTFPKLRNKERGSREHTLFPKLNRKGCFSSSFKSFRRFDPPRSFQRFPLQRSLLLQIKCLIYDRWRDQRQSSIGKQERCSAAARGYCRLFRKAPRKPPKVHHFIKKGGPEITGIEIRNGHKYISHLNHTSFNYSSVLIHFPFI